MFDSLGSVLFEMEILFQGWGMSEHPGLHRSTI
jgi:hypothetical protein